MSIGLSGAGSGAATAVGVKAAHRPGALMSNLTRSCMDWQLLAA